jgi:ferredoxin
MKNVTIKAPIVDLSECIQCGVCVDICPSVFKLNNADFIEVISLESYPEDEVNEPIKNCPTDCIIWDEL